MQVKLSDLDISRFGSALSSAEIGDAMRRGAADATCKVRRHPLAWACERGVGLRVAFHEAAGAQRGLSMRQQEHSNALQLGEQLGSAVCSLSLMVSVTAS